MTYTPPPGWVPPWQDMATLCAHICVSDTTVENWVKMGILPAPRLRGGKRMWLWSEVNRWLDHGRDGVPQSSPDSEATMITANVRKLVATGSA